MRLAFCGDNRILCESLAAAMETCGHQVVAITTNVADGLAAVNAYRPDAVLLDLRMPAGAEGTGTDSAEGLCAARMMRQHCPDTATLVLCGAMDRATWAEAIKSGVAALLSKDADVGDVADALDVIAAGGVVFDPTVPSPASRPSVPRRAFPLDVLTPREMEVLRRIVAGQSTAQMADEMEIAVTTLRSHVTSVLSKLGAHSRLQAAAVATREDLLDELSA